MKHILTIALFAFTLNSFSQDEKIQCGHVPMGGVDSKALVSDDFEKDIKSSIPKEMKADGSHSATFKAYVDCNGDILKSRYSEGTMDETQQNWLYEIIKDSKWTAAQLDGKAVTSLAFITVKITNGQLITDVQ